MECGALAPLALAFGNRLANTAAAWPLTSNTQNLC